MFERSSKNGNQNLIRSSEIHDKVIKIYSVSTVLSVLQCPYVSFSTKKHKKDEKNTLKTLYSDVFAWVERAKNLYGKKLILSKESSMKHMAYETSSVRLYELNENLYFNQKSLLKETSRRKIRRRRLSGRTRRTEMMRRTEETRRTKGVSQKEIVRQTIESLTRLTRERVTRESR